MTATTFTQGPGPARDDSPTRALDRLTVREMEIARLVRDGRTNRQIARALGLSTKTVEAHLSRIFAKLSIPSRTVLAVLVSTGEQRLAA
jgi:DNA-binding NarL/FixJ family response regulator